jgi:uncharacterized membrane protein
MTLLILGLILFLGMHSVYILAPAARLQLISKLGPMGWKGLFALVSLAGFVLLVVGYADARASTTLVWLPPTGMRHLSALLTLVAFIFLVATYVPGSKLKAKVGHPMLLATKIWALAHLVSNGTLVAMILFASFLIWSVAGFAVARRRDRAQGVQRTGSWSRDGITLVVALIGFWLFAFHLHELLIGVKPFGV